MIGNNKLSNILNVFIRTKKIKYRHLMIGIKLSK